MENDNPVEVLGLFQAKDNLALFIRPWVAFACQNNAHCPFIGPGKNNILGTTFCNSKHDVHQITLKARQYHLGFRVAEARIELQHFRAFGRKHEPAIQAAAIVVFERILCRSGSGLLHDGNHGCHFFFSDNRHRGIHTHTTCVGTKVTIVGALMVLRGSHTKCLAIGNESQKRALGTGQHFLHNNSLTRIAKAAVKASLNGIKRHIKRFGNHNTLARGKAVSLNNQWSAQLFAVCASRSSVGEALVTCRRNTVCVHEALGISLGAFQLGALRIRAEHGNARFAENVSNTSHEGSLRADYNQFDVVSLGKCKYRLSVFSIEILNVASDVCRTTITGSHVQLGATRRFRKRPRNSMLTATAAKNQNVHGSNLSCLMPKSTPAGYSAKVLCLFCFTG